MENKEFIAGNKLIAEFLNRKLICPTRGYLKNIKHYTSDGFPRCYSVYSSGLFEIKKIIYPKDLKYHSSWDWLMPVVEKIESMDNFTDSEKTIIFENFNLTVYEHYNHKIEYVWKLVVDFIKWYNENKK